MTLKTHALHVRKKHFGSRLINSFKGFKGDTFSERHSLIVGQFSGIVIATVILIMQKCDTLTMQTIGIMILNLMTFQISDV